MATGASGSGAGLHVSGTGVDRNGFFGFFFRFAGGHAGGMSESPINAACASITEGRADGFEGTDPGLANRGGGRVVGASGCCFFLRSSRTSASTPLRARDFLRRGRTGASFIRRRPSVVLALKTSSTRRFEVACAERRAILPPMRPVRVCLLSALIASFALPTSMTTQAHAEELTKEQARTLFQEALALVAAGDYSNALENLQRVASFKRTPQVVYYIGVCHEKTGKLVMALGEYRIALADAQSAGANDVVTEARTAIAKLEPRIPLLTITKGEGAGSAKITVDGKEIGDAAMSEPMPFDPGTRVVIGQAPGYKPFRQEVVLSEGEKVELEVKLEKRTGTSASPTPTVEEPNPAGTTLDTSSIDTSNSNTLAWISTGVGVAGLGASAFFFSRRSKAISDLDDACAGNRDACPESARSTYDDGRRDTLIANAALGVGAVGVVAGIILFASAGGSEAELTQPEQPSTALRVVPTTGPFTGLTFDGRF